MTILSREGTGSSGGKLASLWERLATGFWFIPALITVGAVALFFLTQFLDTLTQTYLGTLPVLFSGGATAARSVLAAIAGGIISVTGTVFSITIVTLQLASSSYTPRVLRSFTSDRGVQAVLGTFVATFLYSILVLRIIREAQAEGASFNPVISVTVALLLAVLCVALLIYFVAHVVNLIQSSSIVGSAHQDTMQAIARLDDLRDAPPEDPGDPWDRPELLAGPLAGEPTSVTAKESGYVQYVDLEAVLDAVKGSGKGRSVVEIPFAPGAFVAAGLPILRIWPARKLEEEAVGEVHDAIGADRERSFQQDFAFGLRQLSDIALKGLSPGVNDPTTAMQAMDRIEAIFIALGEKAMPPQVREEGTDGEVLVRVGYYGFDDVTGLAFDQIRRASFTSGQVAVLDRLLEVLDRAIDANRTPDRRRALWSRAYAVARLAPSQISDPQDALNLVLDAVKLGGRLMEAGVDVGSDLESLPELSEDLPGGGRVREAVRSALRSAARPYDGR